MKFKRTSVKVLLSASIILSMIPFSFKNTYASIGYDFFRIVSTIDVGTGVGSQLDFYFVPSKYATGTISITINPNFAITSDAYTHSLEEGDGVYISSITSRTSGSAISYTIEFTLNDCNGFHFIMQHQDASFWTTQKISTYWLYWGSFAPTTTMNLTYGSDIKGENYLLLQIYNKLRTGGIAVDLSSIESDIDTIIANQQSIIELLQAQAGSSEETSIDNNEQINEDLQTESSTYEQLESQFNDDFNDNLENVPTQTLEDHLQTWSTGVTWFRTQMDNIYNNLGEFKYIASIAIVLAIALIFIGR